MASYNTVITNEGAALLASVIGNQGTLTFSEMRFSTTDYAGIEQSLTAGTFAGTFATAAASGSIIDTTTIKVASQFDNSAIVGDHPLYSIGIVGTDGNTTALIAVCTTTTPDVIRTPIPATSISTYAFNVNLTVASTQNITVTGTTAAVLYDVDVVNVLTSTATDKPLSANMGRVLNEQSAAVTNVCGSKNLNRYPYYDTTKTENGITFTDNGNGTVTVSGVASNNTNFFCSNRITAPLYLKNGTYKFAGCPSGGGSSSYEVDLIYQNSGGSIIYLIDVGNGVEFTVNGSYGDANGANFGVVITIYNGTDLTTPITFYPMLYDARITDNTFVPFAETNLQLTADVSGLSNENLLLNPFFTVNQRGATTVVTPNTYGADMWKCTSIGNSVVFATGSMTLNSAQVVQYLENQIPNGIYTLSVMDSNGAVYSGTINKTDNTSNYIAINYSPFYLAYDANIKAFAVYTSGTETFVAAKLERGGKSTLAHDVAPNITAETLKCQRYFTRQYFTSAAAYAPMANRNATTAYLTLDLPAEMRATPTISYAGTFAIIEGGNVIAATNVLLGLVGRTRVGGSVDCAGGLTPGYASMLSAAAGSYIDYDARL